MRCGVIAPHILILSTRRWWAISSVYFAASATRGGTGTYLTVGFGHDECDCQKQTANVITNFRNRWKCHCN